MMHSTYYKQEAPTRATILCPYYTNVSDSPSNEVLNNVRMPFGFYNRIRVIHTALYWVRVRVRALSMVLFTGFHFLRYSRSEMLG